MSIAPAERTLSPGSADESSFTEDATAPPVAPEQLDQTGVPPQVLSDLIVRLAYTVPSFSTKWAAEQTCLPMNLVEELCWQLKQDHLLEILGQDGPFNYTY